MAKFEVKIIETSSRIVEVEASDAYYAMRIVKDMYHDEDIVLDYSDFDQVEFEVLND